jgi:hypothetical protein
MATVASPVSPLNCRWITWNDTLPVCTRPPEPPHGVSEAECSVCQYWSDGSGQSDHAKFAAKAIPARPQSPINQDPLNREACPRCGTHDVVLTHHDAVVQSFTCSICHLRWLATRPWPLLRETRSHRHGT